MIAETTITLRFTGRVAELSETNRRVLLDRSTSTDPSVRNATADILAAVRRDGDAALFDLARRYDRTELASLEVPRAARVRALDVLASSDPGLLGAMRRAARNIATVHEAQRPVKTIATPEPGISILRRPDPLDRVGVYAPGGRAAYPSSVLMAAIPARVAGVREVVVCTPPESSGLPSPLVLAAAELAEVDRVFAVGGAGAIAAMAFGTETIPRVDRIVGPGNAFVAEAKLQVCGFVGIDAPAGPSELCIIADESCDARAIAAELVAQAEHDPDACAVAICVGDATSSRIVAELAACVEDQPRREIVERALAARGGVLDARDLGEALAFANEYASEHLLLAVSNPESLISEVRNAGTVFVGARNSVAFGDYMTGANHVLPTGGLARSYSGLSTSDFVRWTTVQTVTPGAATSLAPDVARFAIAERLPAHAAAASLAGVRP
jgi:histidinol dehydrogenase